MPIIFTYVKICLQNISKERELILLKNNKILAFAFTSLLSFFTLINYAAAQPIVESKTSIKDKPKIEISIPQLKDLADSAVQKQINEQLSRPSELALNDFYQLTNSMFLNIKKGTLPSEYANRLTLVSNFEVKLLNNNIVSIVQYGYQNTGGAHPMPFTYAQTINLKTGKSYALKDLFPSMSNFSYYLTEKIKTEIKLRNKQDNYIFTGLQENQKFFLTREGLFIYFFFPYSDLTDFNVTGILY